MCLVIKYNYFYIICVYIAFYLFLNFSTCLNRKVTALLTLYQIIIWRWDLCLSISNKSNGMSSYLIFYCWTIYIHKFNFFFKFFQNWQTILTLYLDSDAICNLTQQIEGHTARNLWIYAGSKFLTVKMFLIIAKQIATNVVVESLFFNLKKKN